MELSAGVIIAITIMAFLCEYVDSTLGMGYGTTLTPLFMLMGFSPAQIVPAILLSELFTGFTAGIFHHAEGNVDFGLRNGDVFRLRYLVHPVDYFRRLRRSVPMHLKLALLFGICSTVGAVLAVFVAVRIPAFWLKLYIGALVMSMGVLILVFFNRKIAFSIPRIAGLGLLASFNKAISGGGYGPVVTAGQVLSGIDGKSAVGITSLAEAITCLIGIVMYMLFSDSIDWTLAPWIVIGALLSVPLSAKSVKLISERKLKLFIAGLTIVLGTITLYKTLMT